ncbi:N-acetylglucosaminyl-diphospho-decaprenol L-rhamnosyltransferase [Pseudoclavibacter triregionum]|nr:N-acetylglucosaminyl-diphospho-decaprenol L-rhamnosyltransferase [Pseudoclavibacter triregionum]
MPSIAAIIVNWNAPELTARAVRSLLPEARQLDAQLVVVDNGSTDGSADALEAEFGGSSRVRIVALPRNLGFGGGVNAGIRASNAELLALLNNDAEARPGFLRALADAFEGPDGRRLGAATGRILLRGRWREATPAEVERATESGATVLRDGAGRAFVEDEARGVERINSTGNVVDASGNGGDRDWLAPAEGPGAPDSPDEVFGFCGGAAMLRRRALDEVGVFDERLFMYYEDTDLSWRLRRAGWGIRYVADAVVVHDHAASSGGASARFLRWNARNRVLVAARHGGPRMAAEAVARTALRAVRTAVSPRRRLEHRAVVAALGDLMLGRRGR